MATFEQVIKKTIRAVKVGDATITKDHEDYVEVKYVNGTQNRFFVTETPEQLIADLRSARKGQE